MPLFSPTVSRLALLPVAAAALAVSCGASAATLEVIPPDPDYGADSYLGVSSNASVVVGYGVNNVYYLDAARNANAISANTPYNGYSGSPSVSASGRYIAAGVTGSDGYSQAGIYDTSTHSWTALGGLGNGVYSTGYMTVQSSYASGISANGSTVVGAAGYSATPNSEASSQHAAVWRNGQVYDLNGGSTNTNGRIVATNGNGSMVAGYTNNNDPSSYRVWSWNGSGYSQTAAPTVVNPFDGTTGAAKVTALSANGVWGAGDSSDFTASQNYGGFFNGIVFQQATLWNSQTNSTTVIPFDHLIDFTDVNAMYYDIDKNMRASIAGVLDDGTVFGTFDSCASNTCGAFGPTYDTWVYSATTGKSITFDSYLAQHGITLSATQHVSHIDGVSADGSAVTGLIFDTDSFTTSSFIVSNISAVPEPGQWALMALGLPLLMLRRLRNRRAD